MTPKPRAALNVRVSQYSAISNLITAVVAGMTGNANFATPAPALAALTAAQVDLDAAIAAWGPVGNRGSHADLLNLRLQAITCYNLLFAESAYVDNTAQIAAGNDYVLMASIINSSGFAVKNAPTPQGVLGAPQDLIRVYADNVSLYDIKLKWKKPLGLNSPGNVKGYTVWRNSANSFPTATQIATTTKSTFIDNTVSAGETVYYWVTAFNTEGNGAESNELITATPV